MRFDSHTCIVVYHCSVAKQNQPIPASLASPSQPAESASQPVNPFQVAQPVQMQRSCLWADGICNSNLCSNHCNLCLAVLAHGLSRMSYSCLKVYSTPIYVSITAMCAWLCLLRCRELRGTLRGACLFHHCVHWAESGSPRSTITLARLGTASSMLSLRFVAM